MIDLSIVFLVQACATWFMTGLIWFVQLVHYPLMAHVGSANWLEYETSHVRRTTWVVAPAMLVESVAAILALVLVATDSSRVPGEPELGLLGAGAGLLAVIWLSTFLLQAPDHRRLCRGFDPALVERLVRTNWIRCAAWSIRAIVVSLLLL